MSRDALQAIAVEALAAVSGGMSRAQYAECLKNADAQPSGFWAFFGYGRKSDEERRQARGACHARVIQDRVSRGR
jgi:fructose-bisphosphate aldolase class 1